MGGTPPLATTTPTNPMNSTVTENLDRFVEELNAKFGHTYKFSLQIGRKNARIYTQLQPNDFQRNCYCFVRLEDGAILKAASWKAPAKGVRAWLHEVLATDLAGVDQYTSWLYRGR